MWIITVNFSGNAKKYDYVYREATVPQRLRYLTGVDNRGPWYQTLIVVSQRTVEATAVPAHVTKELVVRNGAVVAVDWVASKSATTTATPNNNYKSYLRYIGQLASRTPARGWPAYQTTYSKLLKTQPYNPNIIYERKLR